MPGKYNIWWGPPKKFVTAFEERKISWLELFYDLVYVIVISQATHHLAAHNGLGGMIDFFLLFVMIFWGWVNGSMYYDLHGITGIRTRFMTLWQMMSVAVLAVTLNSSHTFINPGNVTALVLLELYITYVWWSVGLYDKSHRKLNLPYTVCYLIAAFFIIATLKVGISYQRIFLAIAIVLNFLPPILSTLILKRQQSNLGLSSSMVERLGLLTIILFGECILGIISGMGTLHNLNIHAWVYFVLGILIVFALWWLFFALIADREVKKDAFNWQALTLLYIPALASLSMIGAAFSDIPVMFDKNSFSENENGIRNLLGIGFSVFLISISVIAYLLLYPKEYLPKKRKLQLTIILSASILLLITFIFQQIEWVFYLSVVLLILMSLVILVTRIWFLIELKRSVTKSK